MDIYRNELSSDETVISTKQGKFRVFIVRFIQDCEQSIGRIININDVVNSTGHEKRRLYEMFSVLCSFNICSRSGNQCYKWNGKNEMNGVLRKLMLDIEQKAPHVSLDTIFEIEDSPSISSLSTKFVSLLMFFLGTSFSFREIAALLAPSTKKFRAIFRRLYPTSCFLEGLGIIEHSFDKSSYILAEKHYNIIEDIIKQNPLFQLLNKVPSTILNSVFQIRYSFLSKTILPQHPSLRESAIAISFSKPF